MINTEIATSYKLQDTSNKLEATGDACLSGGCPDRLKSLMACSDSTEVR